MSIADMDQTMYCEVADVKERVLIKTADTSYDTAITRAIVEASRTVDLFLTPYEVSLPLSYTIPDMIVIITADMSCSVFKRRLIPNEVKVRGSLQPDMINDVDGTGWFALALKKILDYIKNTYALAQDPNSDSISFNPNVYKELFTKGLITLTEARAFMADENSAITEALNKVLTITQTLTDTQNIDITKTLTQTDNVNKTIVENTTAGKTLTNDVTATLNQTDTVSKKITELKYPTKKQKSFGFISGKATALYPAGYKKDSEVA